MLQDNVKKVTCYKMLYFSRATIYLSIRERKLTVIGYITNYITTQTHTHENFLFFYLKQCRSIGSTKYLNFVVKKYSKIR